METVNTHEYLAQWHVLVTVRRIVVVALDIMILVNPILRSICNDISASTQSILDDCCIQMSLYATIVFCIICIYDAMGAKFDTCVIGEELLYSCLFVSLNCLFVALNFIVIHTLSYVHLEVIIYSLLPTINAFVFALWGVQFISKNIPTSTPTNNHYISLISGTY